MNLIWVKIQTIHTISHHLINIYVSILMSVCVHVYMCAYNMYVTYTCIHVSVHTWIHKDTRVHMYKGSANNLFHA